MYHWLYVLDPICAILDMIHLRPQSQEVLRNAPFANAFTSFGRCIL